MRTKLIAGLAILMGVSLIASAGSAVIFFDDFEAYPLSDPANFSATGNWTWNGQGTAPNTNRIFYTGQNFGGQTLWIASAANAAAGTGINSRGIAVAADTDYLFSAAIVCETDNPLRTATAWVDLLVGQTLATASSVIGGPQGINARGDGNNDIGIRYTYDDQMTIIHFNSGTVGVGDMLFVQIAFTGTDASNPFVGIDNVSILGPSPFAANPYPGNGAVNVPVDVILSWEGPEAYDALSYTVYLDPNALNLTAQDAMYYSPDHQELTFIPDLPLSNDMTYYWRVDAIEPNEPNPVVHQGPAWSFSTVTARAVITTHPVNMSVSEGDTAVFSVEAENTTEYQWYKALPDSNSVPIGDNSPVLVLENVQYDDEGEYYCVVDNERQLPAASNPARLMIRRLIAHWPLDGSLEAIVSREGENWDGLYIEDGEPATDPVSYVQGADGTLQGAVRFNGIRVIRIPNSAEFFNFHPNGLTVTAWVAGPSGRDYRRAVSKGGSYAIGKGQNEQIATLLDGGAWATAVPGDKSDGWRFVAMTYDPATQERQTYGIYNNGDAFEVMQQISTVQDTLSSGQTDLLFGGASETDTQLNFTGSVDDVRIYNYPLSLDEILGAYREMQDRDVCTGFPELDIAGPTGVGPEHRDCRVDLYDLAPLAENWLDSNIVKHVQ